MGTQLTLPKGAQPPIFGPYLLRPNGCVDQDATWTACRPRPMRLRARWGPRSPSQKGGEASKFTAHVYCGQTAGCIKMPLGMKVGLSREDFVFDGDPAPLPTKGAEPPIFVPYLLRPNGCMDQDATWYEGRPRPRRHCVRWGPSSSSPERGAQPPPQFSAHFYCGQMAECIRMPLGMEIGLSLGDFVLDRDPVRLPPKGAQPPIFGQCPLWPNG